MRNIMQSAWNFIQDESGPTAVEYAVMLSLIVVVCLTAVRFLGNAASNTFSNSAEQINKNGA